MRVRYLADNDLNMAIVRGVVRQHPSVDFRTANSARLDGLPDSEVLAFAAGEDRILVSHDFQTMPANFLNFTASQRSPGVLLIRQDLPIGSAVESLLLVWEASVADDGRIGSASYPTWSP